MSEAINAVQLGLNEYSVVILALFTALWWLIQKRFERRINEQLNRNLTRHADKLKAFRDIVEMISEFLAELERIARASRADSIEIDFSNRLIESLSKERHRLYGNLSLVSNQKVLDKFNDLIDYFLSYLDNTQVLVWEDMREKADIMLNEMRDDLGISGRVKYQGAR